MRLWDYQTCKCGQSHQSEPITRTKVPKTIKCDCGRRVGWAMSRGNHLHTTHSGLYGKFEPGLGVVVESYEHKQQLMKELDVIEAADPVKGSRCHIVDDPGQRQPQAPIWVDEPETIG